MGLQGNVSGPFYENVTIANDTAGAATYELHVAFAHPCVVTEVLLYPGAAISGTDTNSRSINVDLPDGTEVGSYDFTSGNDGVLGTAISLYSNTSGTALTAGQICAIESELVGTGLVIPRSVVRIAYYWT